MAIPPRWLNCPRKSQVIADRFFAFKTPLSSRYDDQIPEANRFQLPMLCSYFQTLKVKVGLIIDLTNTNRFYDKNELERLTGIKHVKLQCRGHGETPSPDQTQLFINICCRYWDKNPGELIGVHCTHGFNRTGFLIISYLVEKEDWSIEAAVECFTKCRPPGIYKQEYLNELSRRYGDSADPPSAPELPDWCYEDEGISDKDEEDGEEEDSNNAGPGNRRKKRRKAPGFPLKAAKFVDGVDGVEVVPSPKCEEIQDMCQEMCKFELNGFPGSQPVSMDRQNIRFLHEKDYRVSWKADGTRYMMLVVGEGQVYLIDRDNAVFSAPQFRFPQRKNPREHIFDTLIDGEMVFDKEGDKIHPRYLAYDIIKFQVPGKIVPGHAPCATCFDVQQGLLNKTQEPFSIRAKQFFPLEKTAWILEHWVPKLTHENDGLIFNPAEDPYLPGRQASVLKWKPHTLNSVDFILKIATVKQEGCLPRSVGYLMVGGFDRPFAEIKVTKELKAYNNRVIECTWDNKEWKFLRVREDKSHANAYTTAQGVCESIRNPVTKEWLLEVIEKYRFRKDNHHHRPHQHHQQQHHHSQQQHRPHPAQAPS
ncbi:predicted protein [Nematostella vectensis]|uniref:mRNA-capping enzyme n=1 Tax=Nematostella vectensis TaxID=45351 RepID=A7S832_NEMVE|nr:predicted protein [Nematostella vectensis]|eukprot:XP_001632157.1 predicted protein [Nematostella vectensis]